MAGTRPEQQNYEKHILNQRVLKSYDDKYIYCISIIDFLTIYDLTKMGEILYKNVKGYIWKFKI